MLKLSKTFTVDVNDFSQAGLEDAIKRFRLSILDYAVSVKNNPALLGMSTILDAGELHVDVKKPFSAIPETPTPVRPVKSAETDEEAEVLKPTKASKSLIIPKEEAKAEEATETETEAPKAGKAKTDEGKKINSPGKEDILDHIFSTLKQTGNSQKILDSLLDTDESLSVDDIATATGIEKSSVNNWFNTTSKQVAAIEKTGRGQYKFNREKFVIKGKKAA